MRIGFIGIGLMGLPMSQRLLAAGTELLVWNRNAAKCAPLLALGARQADSAAALAAQVDLLLLCVSDAAAVEAIVFGQDGIAQGAQAGLLVVDHSSIAASTTRAIAARLYQHCGTSWIDAPVSGGVSGAEQGRLVIMAGGTVDQVERARPALMHYAQRLTRMGDIGAGQVSKICNQLIVAANSLLIAETVALAEKAGVDANLLAPALAGGFADSLPFQILAPRMAGRRFLPVQWKVQTLLKDLDNALMLARESDSSVPLASHAAQLMRDHTGSGHGEDDLSSLITLYDSVTASAEGNR